MRPLRIAGWVLIVTGIGIAAVSVLVLSYAQCFSMLGGGCVWYWFWPGIIAGGAAVAARVIALVTAQGPRAA